MGARPSTQTTILILMTPISQCSNEVLLLTLLEHIVNMIPNWLIGVSALILFTEMSRWARIDVYQKEAGITPWNLSIRVPSAIAGLNPPMHSYASQACFIIFQQRKSALKTTADCIQHILELAIWLNKPSVWKICMRPMSFHSFHRKNDLQRVGPTYCFVYLLEVKKHYKRHVFTCAIW